MEPLAKVLTTTVLHNSLHFLVDFPLAVACTMDRLIHHTCLIMAIMESLILLPHPGQV